MSKRSVLTNGLKVRIDCCDQPGGDRLRIDAIASFGNGRAQRQNSAFGASSACELDLCAQGCR